MSSTTMSARINLAPEVYQSARRSKTRRQQATTAGILVATVSAGLMVLALVVLGGQAVYRAQLVKGIQADQAEIQANTDLPAAATAAQHLDSLGQLNAQKTYVSKFYATLQTVAPQGVALNSLNFNTDDTIEADVTASSYTLATKFAKALEADNVHIGSGASPQNQPNFTNVQLQAVNNNGSGAVEFKLTAQVAGGVTSGQ